MATPIVMVVGYSLMDQVITNKNPAFVGFDNYAEVLSDPVFYTAVRNTLVFTVSSVIAHFAIGLGFALMLNSPYLSNRTKAAFRMLYILPWLFTVAIIAVLWRLLLNPNGVVNYLLGSIGLTDGHTEWLSEHRAALAAVTFINIWSGYPFFMISPARRAPGHPARPVRGGQGRRRRSVGPVPQRHASAAATRSSSRWPCSTSSGPPSSSRSSG